MNVRRARHDEAAHWVGETEKGPRQGGSCRGRGCDCRRWLVG
ncbi:hypothetical protein HSB1_30190 [Halogranum salarium B-1]|uniref:Uncharacterized protein n=1 Tax=Halogranum salarium B-1 TaxID=1210908 RepID=J3JEP3_9EURY|nr:hypothetical protein HSB1_30190 [Halogranum salarium B-1]